MENVVNECKARYEASLAILLSEDDPGRALDELAITVCLDYASFLPCKCVIFF